MDFPFSAAARPRPPSATRRAGRPGIPRRSPGRGCRRAAVGHAHGRGGHGVARRVQPLDRRPVEVEDTGLVVGLGAALGAEAAAVDANRVVGCRVERPEGGGGPLAELRVAPPLVDGAGAPPEVRVLSRAVFSFQRRTVFSSASAGTSICLASSASESAAVIQAGTGWSPRRRPGRTCASRRRRRSSRRDG